MSPWAVVPASLRSKLSLLGLGLLLVLPAACTQASRSSSAQSAPPVAEAAPGGGAEPADGALPGADETRVLGMLPSDDADAIEAPASVASGDSFVVTVTTHGNGCDRLGDTGVIHGAREATLMVYDITRAHRPDVMCTMILKELRHQATLRFDGHGEAVIRVWGRRSGPDGGAAGRPVVLSRRITVRP